MSTAVPSTRWTDLTAAAVLAAAALVCLLWLIPNHTEPPYSENDIAPAMFPMISAALVLILSVGLGLTAVMRPRETGDDLPGRLILLEIAVWCAVGLAIHFALPRLGFVPLAIAIVFLGGFFVRYQKWWLSALLAIGFAVVVDFGAWQIFTVDLP
ncbi:MAG: tripartite tricarboxylate transporter TctB family protein [Sedimentitalea sp.]